MISFWINIFRIFIEESSIPHTQQYFILLWKNIVFQKNLYLKVDINNKPPALGFSEIPKWAFQQTLKRIDWYPQTCYGYVSFKLDSIIILRYWLIQVRENSGKL